MEYLLKNLQGGKNYAVQIRSISGSDVSEWSPVFRVTAQTDSTTPRQITDLTGSVVGSGFSLRWSKPSRNTNGSLFRDNDGYVLTIDNGSTVATRQYSDNKITYSLENNVEDFGTPYPSLTFTVAARDKTGNVGAASPPLVLTNTAPAAITGITTATSFQGVTISWTESTATDLAFYEVYAGLTSGFTPDTSGFTNLQYSGPSNSVLLDSLAPGTYFFKVAAVDVFGQRSSFSTSTGTDAGDATAASSVAVLDEGVNLTSTVTSIDFVGDNVTATAVGDAVTVTISGGGPAAGYAANVGNGSSTSYTINHGLGTRDVQVQIYENSGSYGEVDASVSHTDNNNITLVFSVAPTTNQYRVVVSPSGAGLAAADIQSFGYGGTLAVYSGGGRYYVESPCTISSIRAAVGTAPTGSSIIIDVNKNGTTIFTTQSNRPTIAASGFTSGSVTSMDVTSMAPGDYLTVDIDQVGSTIAGADLVVTVKLV